MRALAFQRATVSFGLLILATGLSFWLTVGHGAAVLHEREAVLWTQVIILAFIKVRWVLLDFMELRSAPVKLRALFEFWAAAVACLLIALNWLA